MITKAQKHAFQQDGFVVFPKLLAGDDLAELDAMCDAVLDGKLAPVTPFEGWLPDHFYTFWEPGLQDRDDLPRRQRVRLMSNMPYRLEMMTTRDRDSSEIMSACGKMRACGLRL